MCFVRSTIDGQVHIADFSVKQLTDAHTGSKQNQNHRGVAHIIKHSQQALYIKGLHGPWQCLGNFTLNAGFEHIGLEQFVFDKKADKGLNSGDTVIDRRYF